MVISAGAEQAAKKIKMVIFDVDGVLTDGQIYMGPSGEIAKSFSARDGMGITLLHKAGLQSAIITGRESQIVARRAAELKISSVSQGCADKRKAYGELKQKYDLKDEEIAYVGDDLNDLPLIITAGLGCGVGDAIPEIKKYAMLVAESHGGTGAVREIIEYILKKQGKWKALVESFMASHPVDNIGQ
ncbi:MAG: HAD-IIIA family hydrolase [Anaerovibrio sp.]|uniref:KdsC family phosphatase n=1 Tax=Anaerovibrio sp. TaxID=1872532 RepID=UPI0025DB39A7|nr:HAD-IIIA family hydrolase [Anaerovibrio sp.]MCR5176180.1 HAD-IIIA family hydrolase [Anaerovibrio sp.]